MTEEYTKFWKNLNEEALDNIVKINDNQDIPKFDNTCYDNKITEYKFTNCTFKEEFNLEHNEDINTQFTFRKCTFNQSLEFNLPNIAIKNMIVLDSTIHNSWLKFDGTFNNRIFIRNITMNNISNIEFSSPVDKQTVYKEIIILNTKSSLEELDFSGINIDKLTIDNMQTINELKFFNVTINSKLTISDIEFVEDFNLYNIDLNESSKILFENIKINSLNIEKISQDAKYIQFHNIEILNNLTFKRVEFKNTYFNDFNINKAVKIIEKTSFINSSLNSINWGIISNIQTSQDIFRQLKFVYDSQGNHIEANNFYMMEMNKYQDSIACKSLAEEIIFAFNNAISNFGQSWIKPLMTYLILGFIFSLFMCNLNSESNDFFTILVNAYNPLDKNIIKDYTIIGLIYKVFSGLILYHLIIALKRQTKR